MKNLQDIGHIDNLIQLTKNADVQQLDLESNIASIREELIVLNNIFKTPSHSTSSFSSSSLSSPSSSSSSSSSIALSLNSRIEQLSVMNKLCEKAQKELTCLRKEVSLAQMKCNLYENQLNTKNESLQNSVSDFLNYSKSIREKYKLRSTEYLEIYNKNKTKFPLHQHSHYFESQIIMNLKKMRKQQHDLKQAKVTTHILKLQEEIRYETQLINVLQGRKKEIIDLISRIPSSSND